MSTNLRRSVLAPLAALALVLVLAACAGAMPTDDSYFLGVNRALPSATAGVGIAG